MSFEQFKMHVVCLASGSAPTVMAWPALPAHDESAAAGVSAQASYALWGDQFQNGGGGFNLVDLEKKAKEAPDLKKLRDSCEKAQDKANAEHKIAIADHKHDTADALRYFLDQRQLTTNGGRDTLFTRVMVSWTSLAVGQRHCQSLMARFGVQAFLDAEKAARDKGIGYQAALEVRHHSRRHSQQAGWHHGSIAVGCCETLIEWGLLMSAGV